MTSSIKWEPIEDIKAVGNLLSRAVGSIPMLVPMPGFVRPRTPVDVVEELRAYTVKVDVPGLTAGDVEVKVAEGQLVIKGTRSADDKAKYLYRERPKKFIRSIPVPKDVDVDQISAKAEEGVLIITMPKRADAQGVKINITPEPAPEPTPSTLKK
jgi:HSP20 family protein